jgi:hypothetical protein
LRTFSPGSGLRACDSYGKRLLAYLSEHLTEEFGKGFTQRELRRMRQFYQTFPIRGTLFPELSWTFWNAERSVVLSSNEGN